MGILAECPICHTKQGSKNRVCKCGEDLIKAKKSQRVKYWISYRLPDGKVRRESVDSMERLNGYSIEDARAALSKRKVQKRENRVLDIKPDSTMTFNDLTQWYMGLDAVKALASYGAKQYNLASFNAVFGDMVVGQIKPADLESYQARGKVK